MSKSSKPCPKCGGTEVWLVYHEYYGDTGTFHKEWYAQCEKCGHKATPARNEDKARENWNTECDNNGL